MLDTTVSLKYMLAGYAVILGVLAVYIFSLFARWRSLKRDLQVLKEVRKKE